VLLLTRFPLENGNAVRTMGGFLWFNLNPFVSL